MPSKAHSAASPARLQSDAPKRRRTTVRTSEIRETDRQEPREYEDLLRNSLAYGIKRTQVRCDEALARHLDPGLSPARFTALCTVGANPGISQATLGGLLNVAGPSVVKVVDDLERMGLAKRTQSSDRRVYALQLTERGEIDLRRYHASIQAFEKDIASRLGADERAQLLALLTKVAPVDI